MGISEIQFVDQLQRTVHHKALVPARVGPFFRDFFDRAGNFRIFYKQRRLN